MLDYRGRSGFLLAVLAVEVAVVAARLPGDVEGYLYGDSGLYAAATHSLLFDRDLDLLNQCRPDAASLTNALPTLQGPLGGEFALSKHGSITLKQSPTFAVALVPFYALAGKPGLLLFNMGVLALTLLGFAVLAGDSPVSRVVVLAGFALSPLREFAFNVSPDVALTGLLVGGLLSARGKRPFLAGLACGLAVSLKLYAAAIFFPVAVFAVLAGRTPKAAAMVVLGGVLGLVPMAALNAWQFGEPWVTGYERELKVAGETVGLADHSSRFTVPIADGLRELVVHPDLGLGPTVPWWFAWPIAAAVLLVRPGNRGWVLAAVAVIGVTLLLFARYDGALGGSRYANRYLFPAVFPGLALIAAAISARVPQPAGHRPATLPTVPPVHDLTVDPVA